MGEVLLGDGNVGFAAYGKLTQLIYGAIFDQSRWEAFLQELTRVSGGVRTHLFGFDIPAGISLGLTSAGYDPEFVRSYEAHYGAMNAWAVGFAKGEPGVVLPSEWMCAKSALFETEFYNDWIRPQEDIAAGGGAILFKDETRMLAFGGNIRLKDEEKLERGWLNTVKLLTPHLQHAFDIARTLAGQSLELDLLRGGRIAGGASVLLVTETGFMLYANDAAERLLQDGRSMRVDHAGRARFAQPEASQAFGRCLDRLRRRNGTIAATFPVRMEPGGRPSIARVVGFDPAAHKVQPFPLLLGHSRPCLLVTIDRESGGGAVAAELARAHGLTDAEVAVALGIVAGRTVGEVADRRGVSHHTVRNQLKSAMSKMRARRQVDLVRMFEAAKRR